MRYYPTGKDRDSHISGVRPSGKYGAFHDVNSRRDNLPDNVFVTIKNQVINEERCRVLEEEKKARARIILALGKRGKRIAGGDAGEKLRDIERMEYFDTIAARHQALLKLYSQEMERWKAELAQRGMTFNKNI